VDFDNIFILIIIFSFLARAIGEAVKGKKAPPPQRPPQRQRLPGVPPRSEQSLPPQQGQAPQQRQGQAPQQRQGQAPQQRQGQAPQQRQGQAPQQRQAPERAADMIPDDLWMILTGQPRPTAPLPAPVPTDAGGDDELEPDEELVPDEEEVFQPRMSNEARQVEELRRSRAEVAYRRTQARDPDRPVIVSLETEPLPSAARHARFHEKVDPLAVVAIVQRGRSGPSIGRIAGAEPQALRRAIVLQEILGKPRGLE
jgi:hypothetical protein